jgi:hypothetical protein
MAYNVQAACRSVAIESTNVSLKYKSKWKAQKTRLSTQPPLTANRLLCARAVLAVKSGKMIFGVAVLAGFALTVARMLMEWLNAVAVYVRLLCKKKSLRLLMMTCRFSGMAHNYSISAIDSIKTQFKQNEAE